MPRRVAASQDEFTAQYSDGQQCRGRALNRQGVYEFADVVVEHPSTSRLHAVVQFKGETGEAFLFDTGSVHGTQLNRRRIKPGIHVPLRSALRVSTFESKSFLDPLSIQMRTLSGPAAYSNIVRSFECKVPRQRVF